MQNVVVVNQLSPAGVSLTSVAYKSDWGNVIEVELDGLRLHVRAADQAQGLVLCSSRGNLLSAP